MSYSGTSHVLYRVFFTPAVPVLSMGIPMRADGSAGAIVDIMKECLPCRALTNCPCHRRAKRGLDAAGDAGAVSPYS